MPDLSCKNCLIGHLLDMLIINRIYTVRAAATKIFDYRISKTSQHLDDLHRERDETIEKLKAATKYNSTQKLLEKYGGETPEKPRSKDEKRKSEAKPKPSGQQQRQQQPPVQRTGIPPPPTANIRQSPIQPPSTPQNYPPPSPYLGQPSPQPQPSPLSPQSPQSTDAPGFAPNAFPSAPQYIEQSHWYDRLFDALLGEDETQAKNRIVLICQNCRLVNGQAPPGVKTLEDLGRWRCGSCGAWNGESETAKALANIRRLSAKESVKAEEGDFVSSVGDVTDEGVIVGASEEEQMESDADDTDQEPTAESTAVSHEPEPEPEQETNRRTTRSRARANKKKG